MSFIGSIVSLGTALSAVLTAYFFGHGLSNHETGPFIIAAIFAVIAFALGFAQVRFGRTGEGH